MGVKPVTDDWFLKLKQDLQSGKKVVPVSYPGGTYKFDSKSGLKQVKGKSKKEVEELLAKKRKQSRKA
tara:strand:- start:272 stop:475 length:204 start_codon:yes stop_codon:yes gene_type:complete